MKDSFFFPLKALVILAVREENILNWTEMLRRHEYGNTRWRGSKLVLRRTCEVKVTEQEKPVTK